MHHQNVTCRSAESIPERTERVYSTEGRAISEGQARGTMHFRACNTTYAEWTNVKVATVDGSVCTNGRERTLRTALEDRDQEPASPRSAEHMKRASRCIL